MTVQEEEPCTAVQRSLIEDFDQCAFTACPVEVLREGAGAARAQGEANVPSTEAPAHRPYDQFQLARAAEDSRATAPRFTSTWPRQTGGGRDHDARIG